MRKKNKSAIPEIYWGFTQGIRLGNAMHGDGHEALDNLNAILREIDWAICDTVNTQITAELKKSRRQIMAAMNAYRKAVDILSDKGF